MRCVVGEEQLDGEWGRWNEEECGRIKLRTENGVIDNDKL